MTFKTLVVAASGAAVLCAAQAAKVPLYDNFSGNQLDRAKWFETELWRYVDSGRLLSARWTLGNTASDAGTTNESFSLNLIDGTAPKSIGATITVTDASIIEGCAANPTPSSPQARVIASYFNVRPGGPLPGDRTGDIVTVARVQRASDTTDAPGLLRVVGVMGRCETADCNYGSTGLHVVDLGTVNVNTPVALQIDWNKKTHTFTFTRDKSTVVPVTYTEVDTEAPSLAFGNVSMRNETANCLTGPRAKAGMAATFDNVLVAR